MSFYKNTSIISLLLSFIFLVFLSFCQDTGIIQNIFIGLFSGSIVTFFISIVQYFFEREKYFQKSFSYILLRYQNILISKDLICELKNQEHDKEYNKIFDKILLYCENACLPKQKNIKEGMKIYNFDPIRINIRNTSNFKFNKLVSKIKILMTSKEIDDSIQQIVSIDSSLATVFRYLSAMFQERDIYNFKKITKIAIALEIIALKFKKETKLFHLYSGNKKEWEEIEQILFEKNKLLK